MVGIENLVKESEPNSLGLFQPFFVESPQGITAHAEMVTLGRIHQEFFLSIISYRDEETKIWFSYTPIFS